MAAEAVLKLLGKQRNEEGEVMKAPPTSARRTSARRTPTRRTAST
jgi:hypothetical protein